MEIESPSRLRHPFELCTNELFLSAQLIPFQANLGELLEGLVLNAFLIFRLPPIGTFTWCKKIMSRLDLMPWEVELEILQFFRHL